MGGRALDLFAQNDIKVVVGASALTPEELVRQYLDNKLEAGANVCDH
jgi:predicted Fe-Mo cluster-binding NifX family protein